MKPRTIFQKRIALLSSKMKPINPKQKEWAFKHCFNHNARRLKSGLVSCLACGYSWKDKKPVDIRECTCKQCSTTLSIVDTKKQKFKQAQYFSIITTCKEFQVLRFFFIEKHDRVGLPTEYDCLEAVQFWIAPNGKSEVVARSRGMSFIYYDAWNWSSDLEIRKEHHAHQINPVATYPYKRFIPEIKRNGFCGEYHNVLPQKLFRLILSNGQIETLLKSKQFVLLNYFSVVGSSSIDKYWSSIKICIRNRYIIEDGSLWCDYIDLLNSFGKDTSNSKYVCPSNLKKEHDRYEAKRRELQRRDNIERMRIEMLENEHQFQSMKSRFFDISFTDELIHVEVLKSIQAYFDEGKKLHHCVHTSKYFLKENSLVLSAQINGKSIETVEVSLESFQVIQSRGIQNQTTEYHDKIVELVNQNVHLIQNRMIV